MQTTTNVCQSRWKPAAAAVGLIVAATCIVYGHLWRPGYVPYSDFSDLMVLHLGIKWPAYESLRAGHGWPLWKSDILSGGPALTDPQSQYVNPLHFFFDIMDPAAAAGPTLWINFLFMGLAMYVWGGRLGVGTSARLLMAVAGLVNFKIIIAAYAGWFGIIPTLAMGPLLFAAAIYCCQRPGPIAAAGLATVGAAFLVGHTQFVYLMLLVAASYVLAYGLWEACRGKWRSLGWKAVCLAAGTVLAAGITAPLSLSLFAERGLLSRSHADYAFFLGDHHLQARHLATLLFPEWLGTPINGTYPGIELWEDVAYFGAVPLLLALAGIAAAWSRPVTRWLAGAAGLCLLLTLDTPVNRFLFHWLPGYALFRLPNRMLFPFSFLGIALAGIGFDALAARWRSRQRGNWQVVVVLAGLLLIMTAEGAYYARRYLTMRPRGEVVPQSAAAAFFAADQSPFRIAPAGRQTLNYGWAGPMRLQLVTGFDSYNFVYYNTFFDLLQGASDANEGVRVWADFNSLARPDLLDALNVKYLVSSVALALPAERYELVGRFRDQPTFVLYQGLGRHDLFVYRNRTCLPRAYWANRVVDAVDERQMTEEVRRNDLDSAAVVLELGTPPALSPVDPRDNVSLLAAAGHLRLRTTWGQRGYLVVSEVWHPGWRATIDGGPIELHRTNVALMGMWVPPGVHEIEMTFRPMHWGLGLTIAGVCGGLLAVVWIVAAVRCLARRRRPSLLPGEGQG